MIKVKWCNEVSKQLLILNCMKYCKLIYLRRIFNPTIGLTKCTL